jgi:hypothetical protein
MSFPSGPNALSAQGSVYMSGVEQRAEPLDQFDVIEKRISTPSTNSAVTWPAVVG